VDVVINSDEDRDRILAAAERIPIEVQRWSIAIRIGGDHGFPVVGTCLQEPVGVGDDLGERVCLEGKKRT